MRFPRSALSGSKQTETEPREKCKAAKKYFSWTAENSLVLRFPLRIINFSMLFCYFYRLPLGQDANASSLPFSKLKQWNIFIISSFFLTSFSSLQFFFALPPLNCHSNRLILIWDLVINRVFMYHEVARRRQQVECFNLRDDDDIATWSCCPRRATIQLKHKTTGMAL